MAQNAAGQGTEPGAAGLSCRCNYDVDSKRIREVNTKPVIKASICNGEQIAGFKNIHTGKIEEVMLIKTLADLEYFKKMYEIDEEITKEY